eukprot:jgi/Picre1/27672/NNA_000636.t1
MGEKSLYEILGVDQAASQQEIRSAFQARAFELHPDSRDGRDDTPADAKEAFQKVVEAYHVYVILKGEKSTMYPVVIHLGKQYGMSMLTKMRILFGNTRGKQLMSGLRRHHVDFAICSRC